MIDSIQTEYLRVQIGQIRSHVLAVQGKLRQYHLSQAADGLHDETTLRDMLESVPSGVLLVDSTHRIVYANRNLEEMFGYSLAGSSGQHLSSLLSDQPLHWQADRHAAAPEWGLELELTGRHNTGREFPVEAHASYLNLNGKPLGLFLIRDISARKQVERDLLEQNAALNLFAQTVAHDLVGSVSLLVGLSEYLAEHHDRVPLEELHDFLMAIARSGRKMSNIITELLLLASLRETQVVATPVDMTSVVEAALARLHGVIQQHHAEVICPASFPAALGYAPWLEEVWFNYLGNALKYGGQPPRIELGSTALADGSIQFWVKDNGLGIAPERQSLLFNAGQRLDQVQVTGYGLGLSIVKQIVGRLNGQVTCDSQPGQGSVFGFTLLLKQPPQTS